MSAKREDKDRRFPISPDIQSFLLNKPSKIYYLSGYEGGYAEGLKESDLEELMVMAASIMQRDRKH